MSLSDPGKQERIEEFLRKSLLGEEIINTQFHLFSARSSTSDQVVKPRVLCANNILLAKSSRYFVDLLSSDVNPSDPSLSDLTGDNDMPNNVRVDEYGYASDSDLDDEDEDEEEKPPLRVVEAEVPKNQPKVASTPPSQISTVMRIKDDDELSDDGSESVSSDMFVMSPEHPKVDPPALLNVDDSRPVANNEASESKTPTNLNSAAMRLRSLGSRHVLVKDTAFQTWYALLNYLYTSKFYFLPLSSAAFGGQPCVSSTNSQDEPECSAKSMYRLACKVGLDRLRDEAMAHIRSNLSENNILKEISSSLVSRHSELLEMELDVLYTHIASQPVVTGFAELARRIALRELPHGADIVVGIHTRVLRERRSVPPTPGRALEPAPPSPCCPPILLAQTPRDEVAVPGEPTFQSPPTPGVIEMEPSFGLPSASPVTFGKPQKKESIAISGPSPSKPSGFVWGDWEVQPNVVSTSGNPQPTLFGLSTNDPKPASPPVDYVRSEGVCVADPPDENSVDEERFWGATGNKKTASTLHKKNKKK